MPPQPSGSVESSDAPQDQTSAQDDALGVFGAQQDVNTQPSPSVEYDRQSTFDFIPTNAYSDGIYHESAIPYPVHGPVPAAMHAFQMGELHRALPLHYPPRMPPMYSLAPQPYSQALPTDQYHFSPQQRQYRPPYAEPQSMLYPSHNLNTGIRYQQHSGRSHGGRSNFASPAPRHDNGFPGVRIERRHLERGPTPAHPRGPPRKPKQSGYALWVGNLPTNCQILDLKDHFSRDATEDIESVFLISKSKCAFVNYRTEPSCIAAVRRFHESRFNGMRLVCRLRKGNGGSPDRKDPGDPTSSAGETGATNTGWGHHDGTAPPADSVTIPASETSRHVPERYFIVKSLTIEDLDASVRDGIWATQSHNERVLNNAYQTADKVYLIFSVNKSGEYYGYATMLSSISDSAGIGDTTTSGPSRTPNPAVDPGPTTQATPSTQYAPKGLVIDDSARGTIFWEAERVDASGESTPTSDNSRAQSTGDSGWGKPFRIEWCSTDKLPFYRTRGLRNPWNSNREVKIARDGIELEPNVGRRLIQMFHQPAGIGGQYAQQQGLYQQPGTQMAMPIFASQHRVEQPQHFEQPLYRPMQGDVQPVIAKSPQAARVLPVTTSDSFGHSSGQ